MTVERENIATGPLTVNGATTVFPFNFEAATGAELDVEIDGTLVDPSNYAVSLNDDRTGSVTFVSPPTPITQGSLFVYANPAFSQEVNFENQGPFFQEDVNEPIDRAALRDLVLLGGLNRSVRAPRGETLAELPPATMRMNTIQGFGPNGQPYLYSVGTPVLPFNAFKAAGYYNIEDFGAVADAVWNPGDGTGGYYEPDVGTDNTAAFLKWRDQLVLTGGIGVIPRRMRSDGVRLGFRANLPELRFTKGNIFFEGGGDLFFDYTGHNLVSGDALTFTASDFWGHIYFDGRLAPIYNIGGRDVGFFGRKGVRSNGRFVGNTYIIDVPLAGYDSSGCNIMHHNTTNFLWENIRSGDSTNYVSGGRQCKYGLIRGGEYWRGTAALQYQDAIIGVYYVDVEAHDTTDDALAFGYEGAENRQVGMSDCRINRTGGRGWVILAPTLDAHVVNVMVNGTFAAGGLVEANADDPTKRYVRRVLIASTSIYDAGMNVPPFARSIDVAMGLRLNAPFANSLIDDVKIIGGHVTRFRNSAFGAEGPGRIVRVKVADFSWNQPMGRVLAGAPIVAAAGGGMSLPPSTGQYSGMVLYNVDQVNIHDVTGDGSYDDGIFISAFCDFANVHDVKVSLVDQANDATTSGAGGATVRYGIRSEAINANIHDNTLTDSPTNSVAAFVARGTAAPNGTNNVKIGRPVLIANDTFTRADSAYSTTGLGSTETTGGLTARTYAGDAARVIGGKVQFQNPLGSQVIQMAGPDIENGITVTLADGQNYRIVGRTPSTGSNGAVPFVAFDTQCSTNGTTPSNLYYFDGTGIQIVAQLAGVMPGTYTPSQKVVGNSAVAYMNGGKIGAWNYRAGLPNTNYFGFQNGTVAGVLGDNAFWRSVP